MPARDDRRDDFRGLWPACPEGFSIELARPADQDRPWARGSVLEEPAVPVTRPPPRGRAEDGGYGSGD